MLLISGKKIACKEVDPRLPISKSSINPLVDHQITVKFDDGSLIVFPAYNNPIKLPYTDHITTIERGVQVKRRIYYATSNLVPPPVHGKVYAVSRLVATLFGGIRNDLVYPATHPYYDDAEINQKNGTVSSVKSFKLPDMLVIDDEIERRSR